MAAIDAAGLVSEKYPIRDTLFFKIQGDPAAIESTAQTVQQIVARHGSLSFKFAKTDAEAEELWENRKYALISTIQSEEGARCWTTDVWYVYDRERSASRDLTSSNVVFLSLDCLSLYMKPRRTCSNRT